MGLSNLWGSYFSRVEVRNGEAVAMVRPFRRGFFSRVGLRVGEPLATSAVTLEGLHGQVPCLDRLSACRARFTLQDGAQGVGVDGFVQEGKPSCEASRMR